MKDDRGLYYYPSLQSKNTRMYVRKNGTTIEFRLWSSEDPRVWDRHEWIPRDVAEKAMQHYATKGRNPLALYDLDIASRLIADDERD
jgi:hypothetical protein